MAKYNYFEKNPFYLFAIYKNWHLFQQANIDHSAIVNVACIHRYKEAFLRSETSGLE